MRILIAFAVLCLHVSLSAQGLEWASSFSSPGVSASNATPSISCVDQVGQLYTAARLNSKIDLDPGPDTVWVNTENKASIFLQKINTNGKLVWAKTILAAVYPNGNLRAHIQDIAVDQFGYIYTTGFFYGEVDFDPGPQQFIVGSVVGTNYGFYIQKLDPDGNLVWVKNFNQSISDSKAWGLKIDALGNLIVAGDFSGNTLDFDPGPGVTNLPSGSTNTFILKLNPSGALVWVKHIATTTDPFDFGSNSGRTVGLDQQGNVVISGYCIGKSDFDPGVDSFLMTTPNGKNSSYLLKLDAQGNFQWAHVFPGLSFYHVAVDQAGSIGAAGTFVDTLDIDPGPNTYTLATNYPLGWEFVFKWHGDKTFGWAYQLPYFPASPNQLQVRNLGIGPNGNLITAGYFKGNVVFNPANPSSSTNAPTLSYYIRSFDSNGAFQWVKTVLNCGDSDDDLFVGTDADDNLYLRGGFSDPADFDPHPLNTAVLSTGNTFLLKFRQKLSLHGNVFFDRDANQQKDPNDPGIPGQVLEVRHRNLYYSTDQAGQFRAYANIPYDSLISAQLPSKWSVSPAFRIPGLNPASLDFAVTIPGGHTDIALTALQTTPFQSGYSTDIWLNVTSQSAQSVDSVWVTLQTGPDPSLLQVLSADPAPTSQTNGLLSWKLPAFGLFETQKIWIRFVTSLQAPSGTPVDLLAQATLADDANLSNNTAAIKTTVVNAYDPNDKVVFPTQLFPDQLDSASLQYLIRFQNTGTAPARHVIIRDTLPTSVDIASLRLLGASHPFTWRLYGPGILEVRFDMIQLPDSSADEAGSHGFVAFSLRPNRNLGEGDIISNRAGIYFDYNAPIITQAAVVQIGKTSSVSDDSPAVPFDFGLSPNPVGAYRPVSVDLPQGYNSSIRIRLSDLQGRVVQERSPEMGNSRVVLAGLAPGAYVVQVQAGDRRRSKLLLVVE